MELREVDPFTMYEGKRVAVFLKSGRIIAGILVNDEKLIKIRSDYKKTAYVSKTKVKRIELNRIPYEQRKPGCDEYGRKKH